MKLRVFTASPLIVGLALLVALAVAAQGGEVAGSGQGSSDVVLMGSTVNFPALQDAANPDYTPGMTRTTYLPAVFNAYEPCLTVPTLLGPANGSSLSTLVPLFQWDSGNDPRATELRLEVAQDPDFTQLEWSMWSRRATGVHEIRFSRNFDPAATYYWRAWLMCDDTEGSYSDVWSFTTGSGGTILSAPTLIAPANGSTLTSWPVTLQWSAVDGAVEYLVHWRAAAGGGYTIHSWVTESQKVLYGFADNISVEWWASARNDYAIGTDSETWQFISPGGSSSVSPQSLNRHFTVEGDGVTIVFEEPEPR